MKLLLSSPWDYYLPLVRYILGAVLALLVLCPANSAAQPAFKVSESRKGVVLIKRVTPGLSPSVGSGFIVSADGLVYTNRHVIQPPDGPMKGTILLVGVPSAKDPDVLDYFKAAVVYTAPPEDKLDFAILKIAANPKYGLFHPLPLSQTKPDLGGNVAVLGYPHVKDNMPVLSFNKGSISATKVQLDGKNYFQTDAAVNPGNSGGPLLNEQGQVVGIVTLKKSGANLMGYALHLAEITDAAKVDPQRLAKVKPEPGPIDPAKLVLPAGIAPIAANWTINKGQVKEGLNGMILDNNGGKYWLTSKDPLPDNFQLVIRCRMEFLQGKQVIQFSQKNILRMLCVRFHTAETDADIMERKGYLVQFSHALLMLWKDGVNLKTEQKGNTDLPFTLSITKQGGEIKVTANDQVLLNFTDADPLKGGHKFSIGGYLSRLYLGEVTVLKLDDERRDRGPARMGGQFPATRATTALRPMLGRGLVWTSGLFMQHAQL